MMRDGLDNDLQKHGYDAYSVKKLCEDDGMKLQSDYSVMKHAEKYKVVLVTEDIDNIEGCIENGMDYVDFRQYHTLDYLLTELEKIKSKKIGIV